MKQKKSDSANITTQSVPPLTTERELRPKRRVMAGTKHGHSSDEEEIKSGKAKSRRELPPGAVATLKAWLLSPEHFTHPYPTPQDQVMLMQKTGIDKKQLKNWFTNARRRIWKPMLKKQLETGKLPPTAAAGASGGAVSGLAQGGQTGPVPTTDLTTGAPAENLMSAPYPPGSQPSSQPYEQQYDQYGNPVYNSQQSDQPGAPGAASMTYTSASGQQYYPAQQSFGQAGAGGQIGMAPSSSIGSLALIGSHPVPGTTMSKNDSHAVLMELFARDQDLVRQATESAKMKAASKGSDAPGQGPQQVPSQHPMRMGAQSRVASSVPTLNSWPHFSSISSLNQLGSMTGVKSITSMSGADLASQGNLNKMGNLAQVKSVESMGRNDSYAFLEVFFGDKSMSMSMGNLAGKVGQPQPQPRGVKREREEDNDVGLSLEDESPAATTTVNKQSMSELAPEPAPAAAAPVPAPLPAAPSGDKESAGDTGTLKRAYDDALAARGLMSVSRSCEKLTDLALPAKMRKTLSQEFLRQHQAQAQAAQSQQQQQQQQSQYAQYSYSAPPPAEQPSQAPVAASTSQQYPGQHPGQHPEQQAPPAQPSASALSNPASTTPVEVPSATKCAVCHTTGVDTQLRPCGHMFHERCLKPSLQTALGQPKCPIDQILMGSALLAIPTDENSAQQPAPPAQHVWSVPAPASSSLQAGSGSQGSST